MKSLLTILALIAASMLLAAPADAAQWLFSIDLGGEYDQSDPVSPANNWMDCGDIYTPTGSGMAKLWKDDDNQGDGMNPPGSAVWGGYPFQWAPQPTPAQVPMPNLPIDQVPEMYMEFFDLDAEDQTREALSDFPLQPIEQQIIEQMWGIHAPAQVFLSFEDDNAPGWALSGDVPTTAGMTPPAVPGPDNAVEIWQGAIDCGGSMPKTAVPLLDETALDMAINPGTTDHDDDVDALDVHRQEDDSYVARYFSPDHEANLGLDPGDIYLTVNNGTQNVMPVLDDVTNFGVLDSTDIDAFELIMVTDECLEKLREAFPDSSMFGGINLNPGMGVIGAIFSVDQRDPDVPAVDESGGLNPNVIYLTDLAGNHVPVSGDYGQDIDALAAVPEPSALAMLIAAGLAGMIAVARRRRK